MGLRLLLIINNGSCTSCLRIPVPIIRPINAVLDWPMGTRAGFVVFQDPQVNAHLKKVLDVWGQYLISPDSAGVLSDDKEGWFGKTGLASLEEVGNRGVTDKRFHEMFVCDPKAKYHGYKSWDDFVSRSFPSTPEERCLR